MSILLQVQNLTKTYHDGVTEFIALPHVELSLQTVYVSDLYTSSLRFTLKH